MLNNTFLYTFTNNNALEFFTTMFMHMLTIIIITQSKRNYPYASYLYFYLQARLVLDITLKNA